MRAIKLNENWNAQPNSPQPEIFVKDNDVYVEFFLNYYAFSDIRKDQKGQLLFNNCYKYRLGSPNDHGFYLKQFRYGPDDMKWGEFYELVDSDWKIDFPSDGIIVDKSLENSSKLKHYLFYFRDETFECIAGNYVFSRQ